MKQYVVIDAREKSTIEDDLAKMDSRGYRFISVDNHLLYFAHPDDKVYEASMKWEYLRESADIDHEFLEILGGKGWELVSVDNDIAYFKRPIRDRTYIGNIPDRLTERQRELIDGLDLDNDWVVFYRNPKSVSFG
jgi:hypothetical protein